MRKAFVCCIFFVGYNVAVGQYIKFKNEVSIKSTNKQKTLKFFADEILKFSDSSESVEKGTKVAFYSFNIGKDTFKAGKSIERIFENLEDKNKNKDDYVRLKGNDSIVIFVELLKSLSAPIYFSPAAGNTFLLNNDTVVSKSKAGDYFRLIIPNFPSLVYNTSQLTASSENLDSNSNDDAEKKAGGNGAMSTQNSDNSGGIPSWIFIVGGIVILFTAAYLFRDRIRGSLISEAVSKEPRKVTYNAKTLEDFLNANEVSLRDLRKWNPGWIPKNYLKLDEPEKSEVKKKLKGQQLIVGYTINKSEGNIDDSNQFQQLSNQGIGSWETQVTKEASSNKPLAQQIGDAERRIIEEIRRNSSSPDMLNRLSSQIETLKKEKEQLKDEKETWDEQLSKLKNEKASLQTEVQAMEGDRKTLLRLQDKITTVEFLSDYCRNVRAYFAVAQKVVSDAYDVYNSLSRQNFQQSFAAGHLLLNFESQTHQLPVGNWLQTAEDIANSGVTSNKQLKENFRQLESVEEKRRHFKRLLYGDVLVKHSSSIIILAEAFKNLSRLGAGNDTGNEAQRIFSAHIAEVLSKIKATELDVKHVALFGKFENYLGQVESAEREPSVAYKNVTGLDNGSIQEILEVGVRTPFGDDTKTRVIRYGHD